MTAGGAAYDPAARRDTPLALRLKARIRRDGPISVREYMHACLYDEACGYYRTRAAIGSGGDFVTAPEISQVFGELIGLWCAVVWQQMGAPAAFNLVELGPGRGTLLADALRATRRVAGFHRAAGLHLVEVSPELRRAQAAALAPVGGQPTWHEHLTSVPPRPSVVVANELLDALPVDQFVRQPVGWRRRAVGLDGRAELAFTVEGLGPLHFPPRVLELCPAGAIAEHRKTMDLAFGLARLAAGGAVAALFIDYGYMDAATGDTLQAVRAHHYEHPLTSPGEADLTTQVDFASFGDNCRAFGLAVDDPVTQAGLLGALGIVERASRLMAANPARAAEVEAGVARLMSPTGMGTRFKAIGIRSRDMPALPGFPVAAR